MQKSNRNRNLFIGCGLIIALIFILGTTGTIGIVAYLYVSHSTNTANINEEEGKDYTIYPKINPKPYNIPKPETYNIPRPPFKP